jgi:anti-sigma factor RsiW
MANLDLLHAEIDGELDSHQRAELARTVLADPETRAIRDELRRLCGRLDAIGQVAPPAELLGAVLRALPPATPVPARTRWSAGSWRYAAMLAVVIVTGAAVFRLTSGQLTPATEMSGTLAGPRASEVLGSTLITGGVTGRATLTRAASGAQLAVELASGAPVDLQVASGDHTRTIKGLGAGRTVLSLPELGAAGEPIKLSFRIDGREVARAQLAAPPESMGAR